jgi:hypothetical protein
MYRDIAYDMDRWCEVLPHNMTYFNLYVIVSESRTIAGRKLNTNKNQTSDFQNEDREYTTINQEFAKANKSHFAIKLGKCSFGSDSGTGIFGDLSTTEPKIAENEIQIKYQVIQTYSKQFMNEFVGPLVENKLKDIGSDSGRVPRETENETTPVSEGDKISGKEESPKQSNGDTTSVSKTGSTVEKVPGFGDNAEEEAFTSEKIEGFGEAEEETKLTAEKMEGFGETEDTETPISFGTKTRIGENLLQDALTSLEAGAERLTRDALAKLLLGNVYGLNAASNIQDALNAGSLNGLRNLASKLMPSDDSSSSESIGASIGDNTFPASQPETPLKPENMITPSSPEKPLKSTNMITPSSPEKPLEPENMITPSSPETPLAPDNVKSARVQREKPLPRTNIYGDESGN